MRVVLATLAMLSVAAAAIALTGNEGDYNALVYELSLSFDCDSMTVSGTVSMFGLVTAPGGIDSVDLDLSSAMVVSAATADTGYVTPATSATYAHRADSLNVQLGGHYDLGAQFTISVTYSGVPTDGLHFETLSSHNIVWSLSEPYRSRLWWPCKDFPADKATAVMHFTVPNPMIAVSNGTLDSTTTPDGSHTTYHWRESYPAATYGISIAAYEYRTSTDWYVNGADSMQVTSWLADDGSYGYHKSFTDSTRAILDFYSNLWGEYPFVDEKYGNAQFGYTGGQENQTVSSIGYWTQNVIAHEASHQWWGDMITCSTFHDIWLNEGFATYAAALWDEHVSPGSFDSDFLSYEFYGPGTVYVPSLEDPDRIANQNLTYFKGGWVVNMLRYVLGDSVFSNCMKAWYSSAYAYDVATSANFRDVCEATSGVDLNWFFDEWLYQEYCPQYIYDWSVAPSGSRYSATIHVSQRQTNYVFKMPVDIKFSLPTVDTTVTVWDSLATDTFVVDIPENATAVSFDPDNRILNTAHERLASPAFDRHVLIVNGVQWSGPTGPLLWTALQDSVFNSGVTSTLWDLYSAPSYGYPPAAPRVAGHGPVPADTLGHYSTVVWLGNYTGDLTDWRATSIQDYIDQGGNLLLLTRSGYDYLTGSLQQTAGIVWSDTTSAAIASASAAAGGYIQIRPISTQDDASPFWLSVDSLTTVTLSDTTSFDTPMGVGATATDPGGGKIAYIAGVPVNWNHKQLRFNVEHILKDVFGE